MIKTTGKNKYSLDCVDLVTVLGDIHGELRPIFDAVRRYDLRNCLVVQAGDFGYSFSDGIQTEKDYAKSLKYLNKSLATRNNFLVAIRGNHDNPKYFDGTLYSNLLLAPDYSVLEVLGERWLLVGGAISIDRKKRVDGKTWWPDEGFVYDASIMSGIDGPIDVVVTHTTMKESINYEKAHRNDIVDQFAQNDQLLYQHLGMEQHAVSSMFKHIRDRFGPPRKAYNGHFHFYSKKECMGTTHVTVDIDQLVEHK